MIAPLSDRFPLAHQLLEENSGLSELDRLLVMDPSQQQHALLQQLYQQHALANYLVMLNGAQRPSCSSSVVSSVISTSSPPTPVVQPSSLTSPAQSPTSDPWISCLLATNNARLPTSVSPLHQPNTATVSKPVASYVPPQTQHVAYPATACSPNSAISQLARLQLLALQAEGSQQTADQINMKQLNQMAIQFALQNTKLPDDALPIRSTPQPQTFNDLPTLRRQLTQLPAKETLRLPTTTAPILSLPTPEATPSPSYEPSSPHHMETEASHSSKYKEEEDEEAFYVDVESIDDRVGSKGQRKAHIDFYRKLKALRQREKILECQLCHSKVENGEHSLRTHVHSHSDTALYRCKLCGAESKEQNAMFAHINQHHPNRGHDGFEDRRDMTNLSNILLKCFPRATAKTRIGYNEVVDKICKNIEDKSLSKVTCALCMKSVSAQKNCISRHAHVHSYFRCKRCKLTCAEETEMVEHCAKSHEAMDPKITRDFNVCSAADVMLVVLKKCFPTLISE
ncbi:hypothetical protein Tcan_15722 [Toxocara canis]|uniref:C2H2-type domain-containing protein n=2 Tax=Toxocara canis TaxID=6265 RepID=A0A0B2VM77_TOXCA|nr:hypothetical protein Tcan_15722 [Toxocara canis]VDM38155.1 unnamed protein product [Toxocara canis]